MLPAIAVCVMLANPRHECESLKRRLSEINAAEVCLVKASRETDSIAQLKAIVSEDHVLDGKIDRLYTQRLNEQ